MSTRRKIRRRGLKHSTKPPAIERRRRIVEAAIEQMGAHALDALPAHLIVLAFVERHVPDGFVVQVGTCPRSPALIAELLACVPTNTREELRASLAPNLTHVPVVALDEGVTCALWSRSSAHRSVTAALNPWGAS